ncbi:FAD-dependent monooxygenase [Amycolatopsis dendrobii]|uniref:FAD-dependent monooxygenase n=1 Tax=Amycolatopsis dendrobii TaxID=2760662 RepID=A0A7W3ZBC3_9PSEU|nr:FAD-dependent monooxygenase [Amycolatopsis dendrobii]MBB1154707.1 FAD-dependent monooxygenase [Amycolatopsis dendrobii]
MTAEVLIVGAGPTGMTTANELQLAGVSCVLADRLPRASELSKAGGLQSRTQEAFDQRGLLEPLLATGDYPVTTAHFAGNLLPLARGRHRFPWRSLPQVAIEGFLEKHLAVRGIPIRRNHELVGLAQDADGITATFAGGTEIRAQYLVAADGGRSTVRKLLGAEFSGRPGTATTVAADVRLSAEVPMHTITPEGYRAQVFPLGVDAEGRPLRRLTFGGPGWSLERDVPVTEDEIRTGLKTVFGDRVELVELRYARRITNAALQAAQYRHGRVFLAGDAAHVHLPLGAQGMNTGIQDAMNLGWKLAAAVRGTAPEGLLDSYHAERHPVGAAVLRNVQAQSLLLDVGPDPAAARSLFADLVRLPEVQYLLDDLLSGMGIRYALPDSEDHPLVGLPAPGLGPELRAGRGVLMDPGRRFGDLAARWADRVDRVETGAEAMLVRPDGYVAWAGDPDGLEPAIRRWFGALVG